MKKKKSTTLNKPIWNITVKSSNTGSTKTYVLYGNLVAAIRRSIVIAKKDKDFPTYARGFRVERATFEGTIDQ